LVTRAGVVMMIKGVPGGFAVTASFVVEWVDSPL
jgi:hypothetical protein